MEKVPLYKRMRKKAVTSDGHPQSASSEIVLKWADEVMQLEIKGKDKKTMIEGILIDVPADELKDHINGRALEHTNKAKAYQHQVEILRSAGTTLDMRTSADPIRDLEYEIKEHENKAGFFLFMAEHLVIDEVYRLSESDLARLEIAARYF